MPLMAELEPAAAGRALKLGACPAVEEIGRCSHDSEHDLAFMVSDFWRIGAMGPALGAAATAIPAIPISPTSVTRSR